MAGWRYAFFRFERQFPLPTLRVRWLATNTKAEAYRAEGRIMLAYLERHCELPPLNYKFNWDVFKEVGWKMFDDVPADRVEEVGQEAVVDTEQTNDDGNFGG